MVMWTLPLSGNEPYVQTDNFSGAKETALEDFKSEVNKEISDLIWRRENHRNERELIILRQIHITVS